MNRSVTVNPESRLRTRTEPRALAIADGTLEAMKWLALVLMTLDHVNKYLFAYTVPVLFALGRIAMPLFVFVLSYNLSRPDALQRGAYRRTAARLALYGGFACVPFIALGKVYLGWWPLNILLTLLVATVVIGFAAHGGRLHAICAIVVFVVGGALVEYWWFAVGLAFVSWRYCRRPNLSRLVTLVACTAALWPINQNPWALAALPLILAAPYLALSIPRFPSFFYAYYPAHLGILFVLGRYLH